MLHVYQEVLDIPRTENGIWVVSKVEISCPVLIVGAGILTGVCLYLDKQRVERELAAVSRFHPNVAQRSRVSYDPPSVPDLGKLEDLSAFGSPKIAKTNRWRVISGHPGRPEVRILRAQGNNVDLLVLKDSRRFKE